MADDQICYAPEGGTISCVGLAQPDFQRVPNDPGNTLVIPTQQGPQPPLPTPCDPMAALAIVVNDINQPSDSGDNCGPPFCFKGSCFNAQRVLLYGCGARVEACGCFAEYFFQGSSQTEIPWFDSNPGFDWQDTSNPTCSSPFVLQNPLNPIPPPPPPPTGFCTSPCVLVVDSQGSRCVCDPPVPNPFPRALRKTAMTMLSGVAEGRRAHAVTLSKPKLKTVLNPSLRIPIPAHIAADCGCGRDDLGLEA